MRRPSIITYCTESFPKNEEETLLGDNFLFNTRNKYLNLYIIVPYSENSLNNDKWNVIPTPHRLMCLNRVPGRDSD